MKNLLIVFLSALVLVSCNSQDETKNAPPADSTVAAKGSFDFNFDMFDTTCIIKNIVPTATATTMMATFNSLYKHDTNAVRIMAIRDSFWVDACQLGEIVKQLKDRASDGLRIYFTCKEQETYTDARFKNETTLDFIPTYYVKSNNSYISEHVDDSISLTNSCLVGSNHINPPADVKKRIDKYKNVYRNYIVPNRKEDCLSTSVWISRCTFEVFNTMVEQKPGIINGFTIFMGAYSSAVPTPADIQYMNQSTVLLVPGLNSVASWSALDYTYKKLEAISNEKRVKAMFFSALNHGELCPQVCNTDN